MDGMDGEKVAELVEGDGAARAAREAAVIAAVEADMRELAELRQFESNVFQLLGSAVAPPRGGISRATALPLLMSVVTGWQKQEALGQSMRQLLKQLL